MSGIVYAESLGEVSPYNTWTNKMRKHKPLRPRTWRGMVVAFVQRPREEAADMWNDDLSEITFFYVLLDGKRIGMYWIWSDDKRSGRGTFTVREWENKQSGGGRDNGLSHAEAILGLLNRAAREGAGNEARDHRSSPASGAQQTGTEVGQARPA